MSPWLVFLGAIALVLAAAEVGYRVGGLRRKAAAAEKEAPVGGMVAASLGLLAFMLAFTFGLAADFFMDKREAMLVEANAIGTAYLRADFLPGIARGRARELLREYVDVRLDAAETGEIDAAIERSQEIHELLWADTVTAARNEPTPVVALYVSALNEVIDQHSRRVFVVLNSHIPTTIWTALYVIAFVAFGALGYHSALAATSRSLAIVAIGVIFASVLWLIADLDRSREGVMRVSQQTMIDLRNTMDRL